MRISGSYMVKAEAMLHTSLRIQEEMMIANVTKNLSSEGKHVINIIHGTPSTAFGIETQTLTFRWEADTDDPLYKKAEERKETEATKGAGSDTSTPEGTGNSDLCDGIFIPCSCSISN